jgi:hypothetical protein
LILDARKRLGCQRHWKLEKSSQYVWWVFPAEEILLAAERYDDDVDTSREKRGHGGFWTWSCCAIMIRLLDKMIVRKSTEKMKKKPTNDL